MNLRQQRHEDPEVNLTSLIDVVLLLLIFFMISTTFNREAQLRIELPEASLAAIETPENKLEITIDIDGNYYLNDQELTNRSVAVLKRGMRQIVGTRTDLPVIIRADAQTPHQAVIFAMDAARQLGLLHISLATLPGGEAP